MSSPRKSEKAGKQPARSRSQSRSHSPSPNLNGAGPSRDRSPRRPSDLDVLPDEVLSEIGKYLPQQELSRIAISGRPILALREATREYVAEPAVRRLQKKYRQNREYTKKIRGLQGDVPDLPPPRVRRALDEPFPSDIEEYYTASRYRYHRYYNIPNRKIIDYYRTPEGIQEGRRIFNAIVNKLRRVGDYDDFMDNFYNFIESGLYDEFGYSELFAEEFIYFLKDQNYFTLSQDETKKQVFEKIVKFLRRLFDREGYAIVYNPRVLFGENAPSVFPTPLRNPFSRRNARNSE